MDNQSKKETAGMLEHERQNKEVEFVLCLKRISCLIDKREGLLKAKQDYETRKERGPLCEAIKSIEDAIRSEAKFLVTL
jgi:hypothetical protein